MKVETYLPATAARIKLIPVYRDIEIKPIEGKMEEIKPKI